ncbi:hypothetical protein V9T40_013037 [Parthenolecanium corni]|uniref:Multifunctional fusion protein n=1 Tax=Parthenolecanium corni TaxID=536013 RepID=A0AAN9XZQ4_9HEMI
MLFIEVHSKGLKFGIYEDYGNYTCAGYPGSLGSLETDAFTFASWDVDYVKLDGCYSHPSEMDRGYPEFGFHLNRTGRPMIYSCSWPVYQVYSGMQPNYSAIIENCNLWRNFDDIQDSWSSLESIIDYYGNNQDVIVPNAGPGHWNDPDMLIVGNFGLSYEQSKTQMAIWAILAAPLLMSVDLRTMRPEYKAILQNRKIIAVDQDPLGIQGRRIYKHKGIEIWARPITPIFQNYFSYAIAFLNRRTDGTPSDVAVTLAEMGLLAPGGYRIEDLYEDVDYGVLSPQTKIKVKVNPSGVVILRADVQASYNRIFDNFRKSNPDIFEKVAIIEGDLSEENNGISEKDKITILNEVSIIFHNAALLKMDASLREAINVNTKGTIRLLDIALEMKKLVAFVQVSTAYSCCEENVNTVEEKLYSISKNPYEIISTVDSKFNIFLEKFKKDIREPIPGWIDNLNGLSGIGVATGKGLLHSFFANVDGEGDFVPVDIVCNSLIAMPWAEIEKKGFLVRVQKKIAAGVDLFRYFATHQWKFQTDNIMMLKNLMNDADKEVFPVTEKDMDLEALVERGVYIFDNFRKSNPDIFEKVAIIEGDLSEENNGISEKDKITILNEVSIIFHNAALLKMDASLREAINVNTKGTIRLLDIALEMKKLVAFVHVSTAYSCCEENVNTVEEKLYSISKNPYEIISTVDSKFNIFLEKFKKDVCEPIPGWVDNLNGLSGIGVALGKGLLHSFFANVDGEGDFVPVDIVCNSLIAMPWAEIKKKGFLVRVQKKIAAGVDLFRYFATHQWKFQTDNIMMLKNLMNDADKEVFPVTEKDMDLEALAERAGYIFDNFRKSNPDIFEKVAIIEGDLSEENNGISEKDKITILNEVSIIFHNAALLKMDASLREAINVNTKGTIRLLDIALEMKKLVAFVHVSTAYSCCEENVNTVEEKLYSISKNPYEIISTVDSKFNIFLEKFKKDVCEPIPGWVDNLNGLSGIGVALGKGLLHSFFANVDGEGDFVPVDIVCNSLIAMPWAEIKKKGFLVRVQKKIAAGVDLFRYFATHQWKFQTDNIMMLKNLMNDADKEVFPVTEKDMDLEALAERAGYIFDNFRKSNPDIFEKVAIIEGDLSEENNGISEKDKITILNEVSIIFHNAALLKMDASLREAINVNTKGTIRLLDIALEMKKLVAFVHVSTAYSCCEENVNTVEEKLYSISKNPYEIISTVDSKFNIFLEKFKKDVCEPIPGWVDNLNGLSGIGVALGKGLLHSFFANVDGEGDFVPVDIVCNSLIAMPWAEIKKKGFLVRVQKKIAAGVDLFRYFATHQWKFQTDNIMMLKNLMNDADKEVFPVTEKDMDLEALAERAGYVLKKYYFQENMDNIEWCRTKLKM